MKNLNNQKATTQPTTNASTDILTLDNVKSIGERISIKALKTVYAKSGHDTIRILYNGLAVDIITQDANGKITQTTISNGYDIAQESILFLMHYIGQSLQAPTQDGQTDKDGKPITILRACFRAVNRYIMSERQKDYKKIYIDDIDEKTKQTLYYEISNGYDIPNAQTFKIYSLIIPLLKLSTKEKQFLKYRLKGIGTGKIDRNGKYNDSIHTIAEKMSVSRQTLYTYRNRIVKKLLDINASESVNALQVSESVKQEIIKALESIQEKAKKYNA